jgi:hypothetical protein
LTKQIETTTKARQVGDDALAFNDAAHDVGLDDYLDYDPEPYERELRHRFVGYRRPKLSREEINDAINELGELMKRFDHLMP